MSTDMGRRHYDAACEPGAWPRAWSYVAIIVAFALVLFVH